MARPDVPRATYRLQLNRGFTFARATALVPYLAELGVSHVYLSPYFKARPGSLHGYDIVDHNALNPEIGSRAELDRLGATPLERGELVLAFDAAQGELGIRYGSHRFPLDPQTYPRILAPAAERLRPRLAEWEAALADEFDSLAVAFGVLPKATETAPSRVAERQRHAPLHMQRLAGLCARSAEVIRCIEEQVQQLNGRPGAPASFDALDKLLSAQVFRLASWRD